MGDRHEISLKPSFLLKEAEQPQRCQTPGAPTLDHLSGLCCSLLICPNLSWVRAQSAPVQPWEGQVQGNQQWTTCSHTNEAWNFQPQNLMELFEFVCTVGPSLIFQQWLRGSISVYNDSGHLRIKHNTALTASGQELTPPHSLMPWIGIFLCSVNTNKQKPHSETDFCAWREGTCAGSCISPGRRPWPHSELPAAFISHRIKESQVL